MTANGKMVRIKEFQRLIMEAEFQSPSQWSVVEVCALLGYYTA
jgi:hypothetical protein